MAATWVTRIEPAAIARRPSKSGKRGLPGGGATASGAAWLLTVRAAYAGRRRRLARVAPAAGFRGRLAIVALAALAIRTAATIYHRDYPVIGDALTFHLEGGHLAHGEGFRRVFEDVPTAEHPPLFICLIALFTLLGADSFLAQKLLLGPVLGLALVARGTLPARERLVHLAVLVGAFALVIAPWSIRNATTFDAPVLISTNGEGVWVGANCHQTYYGPIVGLWEFPCYGKTPPGDEAQQSREYRRRGMQYMRDHAGRVPLVLAARVGRLYDVFRPAQMRVYEASEGRPARSERLGVWMFWLLAPLAVAGAWLLRRRDQPLAILLMPLAMVTLTALLTYGSTRFRFAAEPSIVVLAAVAIDALVR